MGLQAKEQAPAAGGVAQRSNTVVPPVQGCPAHLLGVLCADARNIQTLLHVAARRLYSMTGTHQNRRPRMMHAIVAARLTLGWHCCPAGQCHCARSAKSAATRLDLLVTPADRPLPLDVPPVLLPTLQALVQRRCRRAPTAVAHLDGLHELVDGAVNRQGAGRRAGARHRDAAAGGRH